MIFTVHYRSNLKLIVKEACVLSKTKCRNLPPTTDEPHATFVPRMLPNNVRCENSRLW